MADFCWDCVQTKLGVPSDRNDLRGNDERYEHICEGCGWGYFDRDGRRVPEPAPSSKGKEPDHG